MAICVLQTVDFALRAVGLPRERSAWSAVRLRCELVLSLRAELPSQLCDAPSTTLTSQLEIVRLATRALARAAAEHAAKHAQCHTHEAD